jgi:hypothetical protein
MGLNIKSFKSMLSLIVLFLCISTSYGQPALPQRTISVLPTQAIDFGAFVVTGPGTITVDYDGTRRATGGVIIVSSSISTPAIFEIKLCQGREITINYDSFVYINGSNSGSLKLKIGPTEKGGQGAKFPVEGNCNFITTLRVGGTLEVPGGSLSGNYSGVFPMSFTQK